jgi:hypothetical protein
VEVTNWQCWHEVKAGFPTFTDGLADGGFALDVGLIGGVPGTLPSRSVTVGCGTMNCNFLIGRCVSKGEDGRALLSTKHR